MTTRDRVLALLEALERPARLDELAARLGIHRNTVRFHLERLEEQGRASRVSVRAGRGRPHLEWAAVASVEGRPGAGYPDLARWLTRVLASGGDIAGTGRAIGRELGATAGGFQQAQAALGCDPQEAREGELLLRRCPYADAALESPEVVCGLHRAISEGMAEASPDVASLVAFEPNDPLQACCKIAVKVSPNR